MIVHDVVQGTDVWFYARAGLPTASCFDKIVTPAKLRRATGRDYWARLVAERLLGKPLDDSGAPVSGFTERGVHLEPEARRAYEFDADAKVVEVGFVTREDGVAGCSPDGLIGDHGLLELKCPGPKAAVLYALDPESLVAAYRLQVQGQLWVTGREWCDLCAYHPTIGGLVRVRCYPDGEVFQALATHVPTFFRDVCEAVERLRVLQFGDETDEDAVAAAIVFGE